MGIKAFALGAAVAYGIQHITKKNADGSSILNNFIEDPGSLIGKPKYKGDEEVYIVTVPVNHEQEL